MNCLNCGKEIPENQKYCNEVCHLSLIRAKTSGKLSILQINRLAAAEGKTYGQYVRDNRL